MENEYWWKTRSYQEYQARRLRDLPRSKEELLKRAQEESRLSALRRTEIFEHAPDAERLAAIGHGREEATHWECNHFFMGCELECGKYLDRLRSSLKPE